MATLESKGNALHGIRQKNKDCGRKNIIKSLIVYIDNRFVLSRNGLYLVLSEEVVFVSILLVQICSSVGEPTGIDEIVTMYISRKRKSSVNLMPPGNVSENAENAKAKCKELLIIVRGLHMSRGASLHIARSFDDLMNCKTYTMYNIFNIFWNNLGYDLKDCSLECQHDLTVSHLVIAERIKVLQYCSFKLEKTHLKDTPWNLFCASNETDMEKLPVLLASFPVLHSFCSLNILTFDTFFLQKSLDAFCKTIYFMAEILCERPTIKLHSIAIHVYPLTYRNYNINFSMGKKDQICILEVFNAALKCETKHVLEAPFQFYAFPLNYLSVQVTQKIAQRENADITLEINASLLLGFTALRHQSNVFVSVGKVLQKKCQENEELKREKQSLEAKLKMTEHDLQLMDKKHKSILSENISLKCELCKCQEETKKQLESMRKTIETLKERNKFLKMKLKTEQDKYLSLKVEFEVVVATNTSLDEDLRRSKEINDAQHKEFQNEMRKFEERKSMAEIKTKALENDLKSMEIEFLKEIEKIEERKFSVEMKANSLEEELKSMEVEYMDALLQMGKLSFEEMATTNQNKERELFRKIFPSTVTSSEFSSSNPCSSSPGSQSDENPGGRNDRQVTSENQTLATSTHSSERNVAESENTSLSIQVENTDEQAFKCTYATPVTAIQRYYILLLKTISQQLLSNDVLQLKDWVVHNFSISVNQNPTEILFQLDSKRVISSWDVRAVREFLEKIVRFDLVKVIDDFSLGNYSSLREMALSSASRSGRDHSDSGSGSLISASNFSQTFMASSRSETQSLHGSSTKVSGYSQLLASSRNQQDGFSPCSTDQSCAMNVEKQPTTSGRDLNLVVSDNPTTSGHTSRNVAREQNISTSQCTGQIQGKSTKSAANSSNGKKLSKLWRPCEHSSGDHTDPQGSQTPPDHCLHHEEIEDRWLCDHYKRRCLVKFACCNQYWPCHRCHNNKSKCGQKKLKSRDTKMVKCVKCGTEQEFSQFCIGCNAKFAEYFCGLCKHLTGLDDHPYHCEGCGICRIHGDRSFHCDVCGVCLDVQLRGNHKCRAGSAHDECCICLEDAFSGCQILPCSHKVHKQCAEQMIRNGITRCPICRQSFAHKLQRVRTPRRQIKKY